MWYKTSKLKDIRMFLMDSSQQLWSHRLNEACSIKSEADQ